MPEMENGQWKMDNEQWPMDNGKWPMANDFLTPSEIAHRLGCHPTTIYRWIRAGGLRAHRLGGRYRIAASDLERFILGHSPPT